MLTEGTSVSPEPYSPAKSVPSVAAAATSTPTSAQSPEYNSVSVTSGM